MHVNILERYEEPGATDCLRALLNFLQSWMPAGSATAALQYSILHKMDFDLVKLLLSRQFAWNHVTLIIELTTSGYYDPSITQAGTTREWSASCFGTASHSIFESEMKQD
jgi:hypothetical protein